MYYYFQDYQFDSNSLLLSQQGQLLVLRNNEARLLHFFLSAPAQVYSKEQILAAVWQDKVVSEQAVFQAISNLRQQFGEAAIRTFPKKGYQWQIAAESLEVARTAEPLDRDAAPKPVVQPAVLPTDSPHITPVQVARRYRLALYGMWLLICLVAVVGLTSWLPSQTQPQLATPVPTQGPTAPAVNLMLQFFVADENGQAARVADSFAANVRQLLLQKTDWRITTPPATASEAQLWASPQLFIKPEPVQPERIKAEQRHAADSILLTGRLSISQNQYRLWLVLQGAQNRWQYLLQAGSEAELQQQLIDLLKFIVPQPVLWTSQDQRLIHAQWQLLIHQAPGHTPSQLQLQKSRVQSELSLGDFAAAQLHSEQLLVQAQQQQDLPQKVFALQQQADIALRQMNVDRAQQLLDRATALVEQTGDARLQALQHKHYFGIWYARGQFARLEADLLQALQLARQIDDQALVAKLLMDLTIASFKFALPAKQNDYFIQTQNQLTALRLAPENFAELELFSGINVQDKYQAEQLFLKALQRFTPQQRSSTKSQLQQQLVTLYLRQQRPDAARALFLPDTEFSAHEQLLLATIAQAEHQMDTALQHANAAFTKASLAGEYLVALEASLLLLQLPAGNETEQARKAIQRDYLRKNATPAWLKQHQQALTALQL
jgi:DNA-binding winged helix-turn-helix (wHTH) protein